MKISMLSKTWKLNCCGWGLVQILRNSPKYLNPEIFTAKFCFWNIFDPLSTIIYLLKINNWYTRKRCEICSKLTVKTQTSFWCLWIYFTPFFSVYIVGFEQMNVCYFGKRQSESSKHWIRHRKICIKNRSIFLNYKNIFKVSS